MSVRQSSISSEKKWVISALSAFIFILLSSPESLEVFLYNNGCTEGDLLDIYRNLFAST